VRAQLEAHVDVVFVQVFHSLALIDRRETLNGELGSKDSAPFLLRFERHLDCLCELRQQMRRAAGLYGTPLDDEGVGQRPREDCVKKCLPSKASNQDHPVDIGPQSTFSAKFNHTKTEVYIARRNENKVNATKQMGRQ
jgi:hypothetical protein